MYSKISLAIVGSTFAGGSAHADSVSWHATAAGDVAVTDNVFTEGSADAQLDAFATVRPGLLFVYSAPRMIHDLNGEVEMIAYAAHLDQPSASLRAGWRGAFVLGPRSELTTSLNFQNGILSAIASRSTPDDTGVLLQPAGRVQAIQTDGSEHASYQLTRELRVSQTLFGRFSHNDDNAAMPTRVTAAEAGATVGLERGFARNSLTLEAGASVVRLERVAPEGSLLGSGIDRQLSPRFRGLWRHDIDRRWSTSLDGGLVFVIPYGPGVDASMKRAGTFGVVGGTLALTEVWGRAALQVRRDVSPNLAVAQNTVDHQATVQVAMPLPWLGDSRLRQPKLVGLGSFGVARTQLIDAATSALTSSFDVARLDVGIGYTPRPGFTYGARYELAYQTGDGDAVAAIPAFLRNTLSVTFSLQLPPRAPGENRPRRNSTRADRRDLVPVGVELVVPEGVDGGEGGGEGGGGHGGGDGSGDRGDD